jgi:pimeloyl-ACP methyl ester carboxylesterase
MSVPRHLTLPAGVSRTTVPAASGELAALAATPPDAPRLPPVLLVPGYTGSKEDFLHLLPLLAAAGHPTTAIDLRGQYESGGPDDAAAYTLTALGRDVASLAERPTHLVGHSFGGLVCREAVLAGTRARSLTLLSSGPAALTGKRADLVELMRPLLADGGVPAVWEASQAVSAPDAGSPDVAQEVADFLQRRFLASPAGAYLGLGQALVSAPDRVDELRDRGVPTFVLYGSEDDAWAPATQAGMADRLGARRLEIPGAGHSPAVDEPEETADALLDFWAALDGR